MARPLWGQGLVPPMGGFSKAAPLGCGFFTLADGTYQNSKDFTAAMNLN